jgi:hypothetical protein
MSAPVARRPPYRRVLLVVGGWYATLAATIVVGVASMPDSRSSDAWTVSGVAPAVSGLLVGGVVGVLVAALLARPLRSPVIAGTLAAAVGGLAGVAVVAVAQG